MTTRPLLKIIGKALMLGSQQFAIGSVIQSSVFSVKNFSKDSATLQSAVDALVSYIWIGVIWTVSNMLVLGATYGTPGVVAAGVSNSLIMLWIWVSYIKAFKKAEKMYDLPPPRISLL